MAVAPEQEHTSDTLRYCLDLSHHGWTRPHVVSSAEAMHQAARTTIEMIQAGDEAGLDSAWISEDPDGWDAFSVLAAASGITANIRLGTGVTNPFLRHPNQIASSVSTLDRLSGGRAFLGLGRGQPEWYRHARGVPGDVSPLGQLETTIRLLRQWWQPPYRASSSREVTVRDWARAIWPVQDRPPIYLAALGPKALDLAARLADGLLVADFASLPFLESVVPEVRRLVASYGRDPDRFCVFVRTAIRITDDPEPDLHYRKGLMALLAPLPGMSRQIQHPEHDVPAIVDKLANVMHTREILQRGGNFNDVRRVADFAAARRLIPDDLIRDLSYVGDAAEVSDKLGHLKSLGVTHAFLAPPRSPDPDAFRWQMSRLP